MQINTKLIQAQAQDIHRFFRTNAKLTQPLLYVRVDTSLPLCRVRCRRSNLWTGGQGLTAGQTGKEEDRDAFIL